jgi:ATP-dependent DNA helicase DinG
VERAQLEKIFGKSGALAGGTNLGGRAWEERPEQRAMALEVQRAIEERAHLLVEAGTGVGKSYAYLVPFILWAVREKKKVLIATHTKALQQQLVERDLPFLRTLLLEHLDTSFRWSLCLGTGNYLCPRRLAKAEIGGLFATKDEVAELQEIREWAGHSKTGRSLDLAFEPTPSLWSQVNRESDLCMGRACPLYDSSFYYIARREAEKAHILVANHHLLFAHLAAGGNTAGAILPPFDALVLDEAHTAEDVASAYLGLEVTNLGVAKLLETLHHRRSGRTVLTPGSFGTRDKIEKELVEAVDEARGATAHFFADVQQELNLDAGRTLTLRIRRPLRVENRLEEPLNRIQRVLGDARRACEAAGDETLMRELDGFSSRCDALRVSLKEILLQSRPEHVYWAAMQPRPSDRGAARVPRLSLHGAPVEIGPAMRKNVFDSIRPVVLTSATLTTGADFEFLRSRLGLDLPPAKAEAELEAEAAQVLEDAPRSKSEPKAAPDRAPVLTLSLGSPFDFEKNALLYIGRDLPDPSNLQAFETAAMQRAAEVVAATRGRAFVLCTSFRMVDAAARVLREELPPEIKVLAQGESARGPLLERFRKDVSSVLVGTTSFWQGVDVPGESLSCVVLMKLPFAVPDDPIVQARVEKLREQRRNPFNEYQVPQAVMMFRQGFGRLIRTRDDRGTVAILDPRVVSKPYGRTFLESLPPCRQTFEVEDVRDFCSGGAE